MIPVPSSVLESLAHSFEAKPTSLSHFGGGRQESDGVAYVYRYENARRLIKVMAIPVENQRRGHLCLEERLQLQHWIKVNISGYCLSHNNFTWVVAS